MLSTALVLLFFCAVFAVPNGKMQIINYGNQTIDPTADIIIFDRLDWKNPHFTDKCGVFKLPMNPPDGKTMVFHNHHKMVNILEHPDPLAKIVGAVSGVAGNAEFWFIYMEQNEQVVELMWSTYNHGWTVMRNQGRARIQSLRPNQENYMYSICTFNRMYDNLTMPAGARDYIATIDILPQSVEYGQIVNIAIGWANQELLDSTLLRPEYHHGDLLDIDGRLFLAAPSLNYQASVIDFYDLTSRKAPSMTSYVDSLAAVDLGVGAFHTTHMNPQTGDILITYLGTPGGTGPGGLVKVSTDVFTVNHASPDPKLKKYFEFSAGPGLDSGGGLDTYAYDYTIEECQNILVATSWGPPSSFDTGFNPNLPYGRSIRVFKMPEDTGAPLATRDPSNTLTLIKSFTTDPSAGLGGTGEGLVPLEVRRTHVPEQQIYFSGITLPGAIDLIYCDINIIGTCNSAAQWNKTIIISPTQLAADAISVTHITNQTGNMPIVDLGAFITGHPILPHLPVPLVTDITLSEDDQFLYVSCWLAGVILQYNVKDPFHPVLTGGVANIGGITSAFASNPNAYSYAPGKIWAGGPQMLRLDASGANLYITNSLFSSWDEQFYGTSGPQSIHDKGGMMIKINTGVNRGAVTATKPMQIDTSFGKNGVLEFSGLTHPSIGGGAPFKSRAHESHIVGVRH